MRFKRTIPAHVEERTVETRVTCDGCGKSTAGRDMYDDPEVTIEARIGSVYPEGDNRALYEVDVCQMCFLERVVPALAAIGFAMRKRDADGNTYEGHAWDPEEPNGGAK